MRTDILVNIESHDLKLDNSFKPNAVFELQEVTETEVRGHVIIEPSDVWERYVANRTIDIVLPYLPYDKPLQIKVLKNDPSFNESSGSWVTVKAEGGDIKACELSVISKDNFQLVENHTKGAFIVSCGDRYDFSIGCANPQNKAMLLDCSPGNSYRYPTIGVGLVKWIGGTSNLTGLSQKLIEQFSADGTPVISAQYDEDTKTIYLNLDTTKVDADESL